MTNSLNRTRRKILKGVVITSSTPSLILASGCTDGDAVNRKLQFQSLSQGLKEAERLAASNPDTSALAFSLSQTLIHCAQSIEYSMTGFPESKSAPFQNTVGSAAFSVFSWRGRMSHDLSEAIPGAPALTNDVKVDDALNLLRASAERFESSTGPYKPHFAYGGLSKEQYALANAMHLANHFSAIPA